jgi:hypothetical protein
MRNQEPWKARDFVARFLSGASFWELHRQRDVDSLRMQPKMGWPREDRACFGPVRRDYAIGAGKAGCGTEGVRV